MINKMPIQTISNLGDYKVRWEEDCGIRDCSPITHIRYVKADNAQDALDSVSALRSPIVVQKSIEVQEVSPEDRLMADRRSYVFIFKELHFLRN